ncbi:GH25 family lysozyme [Lactococcus termiticola]|nr:GH25 family lysozyme [Lactococcus termiticola]
MRRKLKLPVAIMFFALMVVFAVLVKAMHYQPKSGNVAGAQPKNIFSKAMNEPEQPHFEANKYIVDFSAWQQPKDIDYDTVSRNVLGAIIRVQAGAQSKENTAATKDGTDKAYKEHIEAFQARKVPVAVYAYVKGKDDNEMKEQADLFYKNASPYHPTYYWLDVEESNMPDLNKGIETFRSELASKGVKNIGIYAQDWFITQNKIDVSKFTAIWMADYGIDNGYWNSSPNTELPYDMHQFTDKGTVPGYNENVDLSLIRSEAEYKKLFLNAG